MNSIARSAAPEGATRLVDTRHPEGPEGRVYSEPFAAVWDLLHAEIGRRRLWSVVHSDEELGILTALCGSLLPWQTGHLTVWVRLDEYALTRVDARSYSSARIVLPGADARRIRSLFAALDRRIGDDGRVRSPQSLRA